MSIEDTVVETDEGDFRVGDMTREQLLMLIEWCRDELTRRGYETTEERLRREKRDT